MANKTTTEKGTENRMFGYIMAYLGGIATGVTLIWMNRRSVQMAVDECKKNYDKERQRLVEDNKRVHERLYKQSHDEAFRQGYEQGRLDPYDEAERFARTITGGTQNLAFRSRATAHDSEKTEKAV